MGLGFLHVKAQEAEKKEPEVFTGNALLTTTMAAGASTFLTINIDEYTSDEDTSNYIEILKTKGQEDLRRALEKVQKGWISTPGKVREPLNFVRSRPVEGGGRIIFIVKTRYIKFMEFWLGTPRSRDYDMTVIVLKLDEKGEGEGSIYLGTKLAITPENVLDIEQRGLEPLLVRGLKQKVKK